jgi:acyl carrier protein
MGLDVMDIAYRVEKTFKIDLSHDDFLGLVRDKDIAVGDLYDLVLTRMHLRDAARHDIRLNYDLWRQMQRALHTVTYVPLSQIELKTPLDALFPQETRRAAWDALGETCSYRLRELDYPETVRVVGFLLAAGMALVEQLQLWQLPGVKWIWPLLGIIGIWMFVETYMKILTICAPLRTRFPAGMTTVKDLCRAVLARNYSEICQSVDVPYDERSLAIWEQLTDILVDVLSVKADEITFRSRLFRDLGMA